MGSTSRNPAAKSFPLPWSRRVELKGLGRELQRHYCVVELCVECGPVIRVCTPHENSDASPPALRVSITACPTTVVTRMETAMQAHTQHRA